VPPWTGLGNVCGTGLGCRGRSREGSRARTGVHKFPQADADELLVLRLPPQDDMRTGLAPSCTWLLAFLSGWLSSLLLWVTVMLSSEKARWAYAPPTRASPACPWHKSIPGGLPHLACLLAAWHGRADLNKCPYVVTLHHQCSSTPRCPLVLSGRLNRHRSAPTRPTTRRRCTPPNCCSCDLSHNRSLTAPRPFSRQTWGSSHGSAHPVLTFLWARHAHAVENTATGSPYPPSRTSRIRATESRVVPRLAPR
jgi:hypothetical protein